MVVHLARRLEGHLAQHLRQAKVALSKQEQEQFAAFARLLQVGEEAHGLVMERDEPVGRAMACQVRACLRDAMTWDRVVEHAAAHVLGEAGHADAAVGVDSEAVAVQLGSGARDVDVTGDHAQVDAQLLRVAAQETFEIRGRKPGGWRTAAHLFRRASVPRYHRIRPPCLGLRAASAATWPANEVTKVCRLVSSSSSR